nr:hypothetical protein Iba_chr11dCG10700 [Ipomoea batatas]
MEARHAALRACHKGKATTAEKGKAYDHYFRPSVLRAPVQPISYHSFKAQLFQVGLNNAIKGLTKDSELLKFTKEDALKEFIESEAFHDEAMAHADMHARTVVDKWLEGTEAVALNASVDTTSDEIPIDNAYMNSPANLNSVAMMDRAPVLTLTEDSPGDTATTKEEDPSTTLQLNRH